jgi:hypothetical protein
MMNVKKKKSNCNFPVFDGKIYLSIYLILHGGFLEADLQTFSPK